MSDTTNHLFVQASRRKLRFPTQGQVATEDLWDFSLQALNDCAVKVHREIAPDEPNFLGQADRRKTAARKDNELRLEILKFVITTKQDEARAARIKAEKKAELAELEAILEEKKRGSMEKLSTKTLESRIAALKEDEDAE